MVVGDDVAVRRENESGTGGSGLHLMAVEVGGGGRVDGDGGIDGGGVNLRVAHLRLAVHLLECHLGSLAAADIDGGAAAAAAHAPDDTAAHGAAQQGTHQGQRHQLHALTVFFHRLHLLHGLLGARLIVVDLFIHGGMVALRLSRFAAVLAICVMIKILLVVIHG